MPLHTTGTAETQREHAFVIEVKKIDMDKLPPVRFPSYDVEANCEDRAIMQASRYRLPAAIMLVVAGGMKIRHRGTYILQRLCALEASSRL
eukprot:scaffold2493_cov219-Skeletonema_marinoi.AAC.4